MKEYLPAILKSVTDAGAFVAIASMPTLDREGEIIVRGAFNPLPESIPLLAYHDHSDPVGRARPRYDGDALLVDGTFGRSARCQEVRQLVLDGILGHVSVGFMDAKREERNGVPHIVRGELLEVSLVPVPANREAAVLSVRDYRRANPRAEISIWRAKIAALEAELLLLDVNAKAPPRPANPGDLKTALSDAKAFLAALSRPPGAPPPTAKAAKAPRRETRCLFDVMAQRNAEAFDDQAAVEDTPLPPSPRPPTGPSAYDLSEGRYRKDY